MQNSNLNVTTTPITSHHERNDQKEMKIYRPKAPHKAAMSYHVNKRSAINDYMTEDLTLLDSR